MPRSRSSHSTRSSRTAVRGRCTTCSTTGGTSRNNGRPDAADALRAYVELLEAGVSPAAACAKLRIPRETIRQALDADAALRTRVADVPTILSQNVLAALYQAAVEGNVTAMSFWLKTHPPPGWGDTRDDAEQPVTFDDILKGLSDDELRELETAVAGFVLD
jgi:hypothetical protein